MKRKKVEKTGERNGRKGKFKLRAFVVVLTVWVFVFFSPIQIMSGKKDLK